MTSPLQAAIEYLGAVEVAPGRYAWTADKHRWWTASAADLAAIGNTMPGYWAQALGKMPKAKMPSWWSPENTTVWRCGHCGRIEKSMLTRGRNLRKRCNDCGFSVSEFYVITASLETGEEIPA